jgi:hypothetical protein
VDPLVRRRRSLLILTVGLATGVLAVACAGRGGGANDAVGVSTKGRGNGASIRSEDGGLIDGAVALPAGYRESFTKLNKARLVSRGHADRRWEIDVWANESAQKALASRSREVPVGAIVVQEHWERSNADAPASSGKPTGPIMVMEKKPPGFSKEHGDWSWAIVGSQGQLVRQGVIEPCASCHDDAPMDGLFPLVE